MDDCPDGILSRRDKETISHGEMLGYLVVKCASNIEIILACSPHCSSQPDNMG